MPVYETDGNMVYSTLKVSDMEQPNNKQFIHLENLKLWVRDCSETEQPWLRWEVNLNYNHGWQDCTSDTNMFHYKYSFRRKDFRYFINDTEVQLGLTLNDYEDIKSPKTPVFLANLYNINFYSEITSSDLHNMGFNDELLEQYFKLRLFYLNKEDAIHRAKTMSSWEIKE
jgi:hypothetical protein